MATVVNGQPILGDFLVQTSLPCKDLSANWVQSGKQDAATSSCLAGNGQHREQQNQALETKSCCLFLGAPTTLLLWFGKIKPSKTLNPLEAFLRVRTVQHPQAASHCTVICRQINKRQTLAVLAQFPTSALLCTGAQTLAQQNISIPIPGLEGIIGSLEEIIASMEKSPHADQLPDLIKAQQSLKYLQAKIALCAANTLEDMGRKY